MLDIRRKGFTLVETAIVIIIVAVSVVGITQASELIAEARRNAVIKQLKEFDDATQNFKLKYDYLPGDILKSEAIKYDFLVAETTGVAHQEAKRHNGDGLIKSWNDSWVNFEGAWSYGEPTYFFLHLQQAGFINEKLYLESSGVYVPAAASHSGIGAGKPYPEIDSFDGGIYPFSFYGGDLWYGLTLTTYEAVGDDLNNHQQGRDIFTPEEAMYIDVKVDNGLPHTGNILTVYNQANWIRPYPYYTTNYLCVSSGSDPAATYSMTRRAEKRCNLIIKSNVK